MTAGFDTNRLNRLVELCDRYVDGGKLPCAQVQVAHRGKIALRHTTGFADVESQSPLGDDAVFRIYSMTKPITSIALMQLYEQGEFQLDDPVGAYLPEFSDPQVLVGGSLSAPKTRPAQTTLDIRSLLNHTSGLTYGFVYQNNVDAMYRKHGIGDLVLPDFDLAEVTRRMASVPLQFDPGTAWSYSMSTDVCGRLVEVISGLTLDEYFRLHVTGPLGMADTDFHVTEANQSRFTSNYAATPANPMTRIDAADSSRYFEPPAFLSGGGGMVSTTSDYQRFVDMLANGGLSEGHRIIGRKTLDYMTSNHLPGGGTLNELGQSIFSETTMEGVGFGLGFSVLVDPIANGLLSSKGEFAWGGAATTGFFVDPVEDVTCVFMTQFMPSSAYPIRRQLKTAIYQALT